jgi:alanyl-tRNA synthetase
MSYAVVIKCSPKAIKHGNKANELLQRLIDAFGGKGGGNSELARGKLDSMPDNWKDEL